MVTLRDYQIEAANSGLSILKQKGILILNFQVRTGKTHIALEIAKHYKSILFVTKKKAISSIENDYKAANHTYDFTVINYEQLYKYKPVYDLIVFDESHSLAALGKPTLRTKEAKRICTTNPRVILMSGTLLPENNAQIFHQLWASNYSPFAQWINFYKWHNHFGTPKLKYTSYGTAMDYSIVDYAKIKPYIEPIMLTYTQQEAGFISQINEHVLTVEMKQSTYDVIKQLKKDKIVEGKAGVVLADTAVKEMMKVHQMSSGTVKFEDGTSVVFDFSKALFIKEKFAGKKLAIFYKFKAELEAIKQHLSVTDNIEDFNNDSGLHIALQIKAGSEGINLSAADAIVYYNIDFSAVSYWQSRDRMTTITRATSEIYWLFSNGGIEWQIYKCVANKKDFVLQTYRKIC